MVLPEDFPLKVQLMRYFLRWKGGFASDIADTLSKNLADVHDIFVAFSKSGYIVLNENPPPAIRKTVYWQIVENSPVLFRLYNDREFEFLREQIRSEKWIRDIMRRKFNGYPEALLLVIPKMFNTSPSFFEVLLKYETLEQLKDYYRPYLRVNQFFIGIDNFAEFWLLYQLFVECITKDKESNRITEIPDGIIDEVFGVLTNISPTSRQSGNINNLQLVVQAIEQTFPYWGEEQKTLKESIFRDILEFKARCAEANLRPPVLDYSRTEYYAAFLNILHNLQMDQYGDLSDPLNPHYGR